MTISAGTRLGPYEVVAPIGAGGMGEVYRARDTRLDRSVAIKILPAGYATDAHLKQRFEREAKTISQLNHPNICTVYDVGHENGTDYLVMELLEGQTLAERLARGPLPLADVLTYGIQIAEALEKAHRAGIVHRDLKPANMMLTKSGAKLLDFGLAKSASVLVSSESATHHRPLTQEGTIVGTFQYMAPEQLEGVEADARTDIFALGTVLYEMATGKRAFEGKTKTSLIAAIVSAEPMPISRVQPLTPAAFEHVVQRCLAKEPDDRWRSTHDVAEELKWIREKGSEAGIVAPAGRGRRLRPSWFLLPLLVIAASALTWAIIRSRREPPRILQATILPPQKMQFDAISAGSPALSPDGERLAFAAAPAGGGTRSLFVQSLSSRIAQPLAGTDDAAFPFWSPDGEMIGFFAASKLKKVDASGGPVQTLCDAPIPRGGSWSKSGVIIFAASTAGPISKVSEDGGPVTPVTVVGANRPERSHRWPSFLPDGNHFLYSLTWSAVSANLTNNVFVGSLDGKVNKPLLVAGSQAVYSSGHLLYCREGSLVAQPFDLKTLSLGRQVTPLAETVGRTPRVDAFFTVSDSGILIYQEGSASADSELVWFDATGKALQSVSGRGDYRGICLSHDDHRVVVARADGVSGRLDLWVLDLLRGTQTRLTFDAGNEFAAHFSPDDSMITYASDAKSAGDIVIRRSSGTGAEEVAYASRTFKVPSDWSPDGKTLLIQEQSGADWDMWLFSLGDHKLRPFVNTPFAEQGGVFSPDGRWVAYWSNESGQNQVYVVPVSGSRGKWQISAEGGARPHWSRDGKHLYYLSLESRMNVVDVSTNGDEFVASVPRFVFAANVKRLPGNMFEVSSDSKRFLINAASAQTESPLLNVVENWNVLLKKEARR